MSDVALYLPFALIDPNGFVPAMAVIFLSALTEFTGVLGQTVGASRRYDGPLGKSDRAVLFGALGIFAAVGGTFAAWKAVEIGNLAAILSRQPCRISAASSWKSPRAAQNSNMDVYRSGNITIANAPGTGICDDKAIYSYMFSICESWFGMSSSPYCRSVP